MQQRETQVLGSLCLSGASFKYKESQYFVVGLQFTQMSTSDPRAISNILKGQLNIYNIS